MEIKELAEKEIQKMQKVFSKLKKRESNEILELATTYFKDAKHFFKKGKFLEAFEAAVISWAYIDALLHFKLVELPDELKKLFTIE